MPVSGPVSDPLVRSFLRSTRWAPSTRRVTAWVLHNFSVWAEQRGIKLCDISRDDVEGYLTERAALGLAPATLRGDWRALRALYRWLVEEGEIDRDPTRRIPGPRVSETPVKVLADDDYRRLVKTCDRRTTVGRRDEAILSLLWHTGLRRGELIALDLGDVDLEGARLTVGSVQAPTKTGRVRRPPLARDTVDALERYLRRRGGEEGALFLPQRGDRLGDGGLTAMVARRAEAAGFERRVGCHEFRRAFATRFKRRGGSDPALMAIAGWKSPAMVMRYTRMESEDLAAEEFHRLIDESAPRRRRPAPRRRAG